MSPPRHEETFAAVCQAVNYSTQLAPLVQSFMKTIDVFMSASPITNSNLYSGSCPSSLINRVPDEALRLICQIPVSPYCEVCQEPASFRNSLCDCPNRSYHQ